MTIKKSTYWIILDFARLHSFDFRSLTTHFDALSKHYEAGRGRIFQYIENFAAAQREKRGETNIKKCWMLKLSCEIKSFGAMLDVRAVYDGDVTKWLRHDGEVLSVEWADLTDKADED